MFCLRGRGIPAGFRRNAGTSCLRERRRNVQQRAGRNIQGWPCALLLAVSLALGGPASAAPPERRDSDEEVAALVRLGDRSRLEGRFLEAEVSYRAAFARRPEDAIALGLALSLAAQGKAREAAPWLARLSESAALSDDARAEAARALLDVKREVATIELRVSLTGASIDVDGAAAGTSPIAGAMFLEPGNHTLRASLGGFLPTQASIDAAAGRAYVVELALVPDPMLGSRWTPSVSHGFEGDGAPGRASTHSAPNPGATGYTALDGEPSFADYFLPPGGPVRAGGLALAIVAGVGGAAALGIASENDRLVADYKHAATLRPGESCFDTKPAADPDCQRLAQAMAVSKNANTAGAVLLGGAGVAAGIALVSVFLLPPPSVRGTNAQPILKLTPTAGLSFGGMSLEATW